MYAKGVKRCLDIVISLSVLVVLSPVYLLLIVIGAIAMRGNPFFVQARPGKGERIFALLKFRSMNNRRDEKGELLPDAQRLSAYGRFLRETSLDELPEFWNILKGDMSLVGPRPLLVRDMVMMTPEQRRRHTVRQGLTGLAQVSGRNNLSWERKLELDLAYIERITFWGDVKIVFKTVGTVLSGEDVSRNGTATDVDYGDWLLQNGKIERHEYEQKQGEATKLLKG